MSHLFRFSLLVGAIVCLTGSMTVSRADESSEKKPDSSQVDADKAKASVLAWIDDYSEKQVLFHDEDIARLRKELEDDSPEEAVKWWKKTASARAALESPEWAETREWLREFLRVQAIYTDEQVDEFRAEAKEAAAKESPREFKDILADIEMKRKNLIQSSADNKALREHQVTVIDAFRKEQSAERIAAARAAATRAPVNPVQSAPVRSRSARYSRPPLVDSLDAARWGVMRSFYRW